jgi:hypothetical protein
MVANVAVGKFLAKGRSTSLGIAIAAPKPKTGTDIYAKNMPRNKQTIKCTLSMRDLR